MANEHDNRYKSLFSNSKMVKQLLTSFVKEDFVHELDYSTLENSTEKNLQEHFGKLIDLIKEEDPGIVKQIGL